MVKLKDYLPFELQLFQSAKVLKCYKNKIQGLNSEVFIILFEINTNSKLPKWTAYKIWTKSALKFIQHISHTHNHTLSLSANRKWNLLETPLPATINLLELVKSNLSFPLSFTVISISILLEYRYLNHISPSIWCQRSNFLLITLGGAIVCVLPGRFAIDWNFSWKFCISKASNC